LSLYIIFCQSLFQIPSFIISICVESPGNQGQLATGLRKKWVLSYMYICQISLQPVSIPSAPAIITPIGGENSYNPNHKPAIGLVIPKIVSGIFFYLPLHLIQDGPNFALLLSRHRSSSFGCSAVVHLYHPNQAILHQKNHCLFAPTGWLGHRWQTIHFLQYPVAIARIIA